MIWVSSTDGVEVALHELSGAEPDGSRPLVLVAHATGFHGRAYLPVAAGLTPAYRTVALDFRGYGDTLAPPGRVEWRGYGDDVDAVAGHLADDAGAEDGLIAFGHSKGGAALLMAADRHPERFRLLVLFEPIVFPPGDPDVARPESPLAAGARRRRPTFASLEAATENYAAKWPMATFDSAALDAYVRYGFRDDPDGDGVRLKCEPEHEAQTFETGGDHDTWSRLPGIDVPVVVVAGVVDETQPSAHARSIAEALPQGRYLERPELDHFGPFTHPRPVADLIASAAARLEDDTPVVP